MLRRDFMTSAALAGVGCGLGVLPRAGEAGSIPAEPELAGREPLVLLCSYLTGLEELRGRPSPLGESLRALRPGVLLTLKREGESAFDPDSVAVWTQSEQGQRLGSLPAIETRAIARLLDADEYLDARLTGIDFTRRRPDVRLEVRLWRRLGEVGA